MQEPPVGVLLSGAGCPDELAGGGIRGHLEIAGHATGSNMLDRHNNSGRRVQRNPLLAIVGNPHRSPAQISQEIKRTEEALEDAVYFARPPAEILVLREKLAELQDLFQGASERWDSQVSDEIRQGRFDYEREQWRRGGRGVIPVRDEPDFPPDSPWFGRENPYVHPLAFEARGRFFEDTEAGHDDAAEYWRGQAGAYFTTREPAKKPKRKPVAGGGTRGRVKSKGKGSKKNAPKKVRKNRVAPKSQKKHPLKKRRFTLDEARKRFDGFDAALKAYEKFHGRAPAHVDVYVLEDGDGEVRIEPVHAALHRTLETNYVVPWDSNKKGTLWLHEHKEGHGLRGLAKGKAIPDPKDLPLEVFDPRTHTTRKLGGKFKIKDWWFD